jgi:sugar phosphate isomerase/epimerase
MKTLQRQISVSTVVFEGYPIDHAFEELSRLGIKLVEPAYIKGYMDFSEEDFGDTAIAAMTKKLTTHGLTSIAISAHMDSGNPDASEMLARRIRFTAGIGARYTITNSTTTDRRENLQKTLEENLRLAENMGIIIALENPGQGPTNLMVDGQTGVELVRSFNSPWLRMNYDTANAFTCTESSTRPEQDIDHALPVTGHMHLKDVIRHEGRWRYVAIGSGELDYNVILSKLTGRPDIPLTLELPLRLNRVFNREFERNPDVSSLQDIKTAIRNSWNSCATAFGDMEQI